MPSCPVNNRGAFFKYTLANGVRWYGLLLRRDNVSVLRVALDFEVSGKRKQERVKKTWKKKVEGEQKRLV